MRILLTGANGQLGRHLAPMLEAHHELVLSTRAATDLTQPDAVDAMLEQHQPELVINTAAMTAVDAAEDEPVLADQLNHQLPDQLARWCGKHAAGLIHYSTDYVFSGQNERPWREDDPTDPQSVYGLTKHLGEQAIASHRVGALIIRTAWVYSALPGNFLSAILGKAKQGMALSVVNDQIGSPTWAGSLAHASARLIDGGHLPKDQVALLHIANQGAISWYEFACKAVELAAQMGVIDQAVPVEAVGSDQWPQKAKRPAWSVLDCSRYETLTGASMPAYQQALAECLSKWSEWRC
ncbi:MAG TPA: dTDP-4-dehydrorhamnose reductase [Wenzhouxiangella sp.]